MLDQTIVWIALVTSGAAISPAALAQAPELPARGPVGPVEALVPEPAADPASRCVGSFSRAAPWQSASIELFADGRFEWVERDCTSSRRYSGSTRWVGTELTLVAQTEQHFGPFLAVPWGPRLYLVEVARLQEFCFAIDAGSEPRSGVRHPLLLRQEGPGFFLRRDDWLLPAEGQPELPPDCAQRLLPCPVTGRVIALETFKRMRVDLGRRDGVQTGNRLTLWLQSDERAAVERGEPLRVRVESVTEDSCVIAGLGLADQARIGLIITGRIPLDGPEIDSVLAEQRAVQLAAGR